MRVTHTIVGVTALLLGCRAMAQSAPQVLNYQGRLVKTNGAVYPNGTVQVRVKVMSAPSGGTTLWDSGLRSVTVRSGAFSLALQGGTPPMTKNVFSQGPTWFEVSVVDAQNQEFVLFPRQLVSVAPWAFWAETVSDASISSSKLASDPNSLAKVTNGVMSAGSGGIAIGAPLTVSGPGIYGGSGNFFSTNGPNQFMIGGYRSPDYDNSAVLYLNDLTAGGFGWIGLQARIPGPLGSMVFGLNAIERMRITPTGDVFVGSGTSSGRLVVFGNGKIGGQLSIDGANAGIEMFDPSGTQAHSISVNPPSHPLYPGSLSIGYYPMSLSIGPTQENNGTQLTGERLQFFSQTATTSGIEFRRSELSNLAAEMVSPENGVISFNSPHNPSGGARLRANSFELPSSRRFKTDIQPLSDGLGLLLSLRPVTYVRKNSGSGPRETGLIAEEVAKVCPDVVGYESDGKTPVAIDYSKLVPLLVKAAQQQSAMIEQQGRRIAVLEQQIKKLKSARGK